MAACGGSSSSTQAQVTSRGWVGAVLTHTEGQREGVGTVSCVGCAKTALGARQGAAGSAHLLLMTSWQLPRSSTRSRLSQQQAGVEAGHCLLWQRPFAGRTAPTGVPLGANIMLLLAQPALGRYSCCVSRKFDHRRPESAEDCVAHCMAGSGCCIGLRLWCAACHGAAGSTHLLSILLKNHLPASWAAGGLNRQQPGVTHTGL